MTSRSSLVSTVLTSSGFLVGSDSRSIDISYLENAKVWLVTVFSPFRSLCLLDYFSHRLSLASNPPKIGPKHHCSVKSIVLGRLYNILRLLLRVQDTIFPAKNSFYFIFLSKEAEFTLLYSDSWVGPCDKSAVFQFILSHFHLTNMAEYNDPSHVSRLSLLQLTGPRIHPRI